MEERCERHDQAIVRLETKVDFIVDSITEIKENKKTMIENNWKIVMLIVAIVSFLTPIVVSAVSR